jgi:ABC-type multidrug transport system ATPase subunit
LVLSCGVILSTHLLSEAQAVCDRVVILDEGAVMADQWTRPSGTPGGLEEAFFRALGGNPT